MDRAAKRELIDHLHAELKSTGVVVVAHNTGLVAAQSADFRKRVKDAGGSVKVAKNKLAQLALKDTKSEGVTPLLKGQTCIAYSEDPISAARVSVMYSKDNEKLVILGGAMGNTVMDVNGVKALAELPSLDELRAKIIGLVQAPATKVAQIAAAPAGQLARVFGAYAAKEAA